MKPKQMRYMRAVALGAAVSLGVPIAASGAAFADESQITDPAEESSLEPVEDDDLVDDEEPVDPPSEDPVSDDLDDVVADQVEEIEPEAEPVVVPAQPPTFSDDSVSIPDVDGVVYSIDGVPTSPGTFSVDVGDGPTTVTVTVAPSDGAQIEGVTEWTGHFSPPESDAPVEETEPSETESDESVQPETDHPVEETTQEDETHAVALETTFPESIESSDSPGAQDDWYMIPSIEGVRFLVDGKEIGPGTHRVDSHDDGVATVVVVAETLDGYTTRDGETQRSWTLTFSATTMVEGDLAPTFVDDHGDADIVTIPDVEGVDYVVNGAPTPPGSYTVSDYVDDFATVVVSVTARPGYRIPDGVETSWTHKFDGRFVAPAPSAPVANDADGTDDDTITIPDVEGVRYVVSGVVVTGTIHVGAFGVGSNGLYSVSVIAGAAPGWVLPDDALTEWTFTFDSRRTIGAPQAPAFADNPGWKNDQFVVPDIPGVRYTYDGKQVSGTVNVPESAYDKESGTAVVILEAHLIDGWKLIEGTNIELYNQRMVFTYQTSTQIPTATASGGDGEDAVINLPWSVGTTWFVNGSPISQGEGEDVVYVVPPSAYVDGPFANVVVQAVASDGYVYPDGETAGPRLEFRFDSRRGIDVPDAYANERVRDDPDSFTVVESEGVEWILEQPNGKVVKIKPGVYEVPFNWYAAGHATFGLVSIPKDGYRIDTEDGEAEAIRWQFEFDRLFVVQPEPPSYEDSLVTHGGTYTIPDVEGVRYVVDNEVKPAGTYNASGTVIISAEAEDGYRLHGDVLWFHEFPDEVTGAPSNGTFTSHPVPGAGSSVVTKTSYRTGSDDWLADSGADTGVALLTSIALMVGGGMLVRQARRKGARAQGD